MSGHLFASSVGVKCSAFIRTRSHLTNKSTIFKETEGVCYIYIYAMLTHERNLFLFMACARLAAAPPAAAAVSALFCQ